MYSLVGESHQLKHKYSPMNEISCNAVFSRNQNVCKSRNRSMLRIRNPWGRAKWLSSLRHQCYNSFENTLLPKFVIHYYLENFNKYTNKNQHSGIESTELKRKEHAPLWVYLKVLGLVSKLEEYLDPRLNLFTRNPLSNFSYQLLFSIRMRNLIFSNSNPNHLLIIW